MHNLYLLNEMIEFIEHRWSKDPICPHCGHEQKKSFIFKATTPHLDSDCDNCRKEFRLWEEIDCSYSTEKL